MKKRMLALLLACVMVLLAVPAVLPIAAAEANLFSESFREATDVEFSGDTRVMPEPTDIPFLFEWFNADDTPMTKNTVVADDCYAKYNQVLIDAGVFSPDEPFSVILEKYRAHLDTYGNLTFKGNWEMVNLRFDGTRLGMTTSLTRAFMNQRGSIYGLYYDRNRPQNPIKTAECWEQFVLYPTVVRDSLMTQMFESMVPAYVEPGTDGKILFAEIKSVYPSIHGQTYGTTEWSSGANTQDGTIYAYPSTKSSTAYMYTVPDMVVGEAKVTIDAIEFCTKYSNAYANPGKICLVYNKNDGKDTDTVAVWPEGADFANTTTWLDISRDTTAAELNETLKDVVLNVSPGDKIGIAVHRSGGAIAVKVEPTITIDKECVVQFQDESGNPISSGGGKVGQPFPKAPYAAGEGGYLINDVPASELPETITGDMVVKYVGDVVVTDAVVEAVSISVSSDFAINIFFKPDPYATKVGVLDEDGEAIWGTQQADGNFKISVPNLSAKDMDQMIVLQTVQEFIDGRQYDGSEDVEIVPTEVLAAYADSEATAAQKAVAAAALDYAAAAKAYFYGEVLDAEVEARLAAQDEAIAAIESNVKYADKKEYCINGVALVLRDQVAFKIRVSLSEITFLDEEALDYTVVVEQGGVEVVYDHGFEFTPEDEGLMMAITLGGIAAADFDATFKITITDVGYPVSETFEYSVNDYIARRFDANRADANVIRAIYALGVAANNA